MFLHILWGNTHFLTDFKGWNEVSTQQHPLWAWAYLPNNLQGGRVIPLFFTKQDGGRRRGEGLREALQLWQLWQLWQFSGEGYMNSGCFQIVIIIFNLLYIFYIYYKLPLKRGRWGRRWKLSQLSRLGGGNGFGGWWWISCFLLLSGWESIEKLFTSHSFLAR